MIWGCGGWRGVILPWGTILLHPSCLQHGWICVRDTVAGWPAPHHMQGGGGHHLCFQLCVPRPQNQVLLLYRKTASHFCSEWQISPLMEPSWGSCQGPQQADPGGIPSTAYAQGSLHCLSHLPPLAMVLQLPVLALAEAHKRMKGAVLYFKPLQEEKKNPILTRKIKTCVPVRYFFTCLCICNSKIKGYFKKEGMDPERKHLCL